MSPSLFDPTPPPEPESRRPLSPPAPEPPTARRSRRPSRSAATALALAALVGGGAGAAVVAIADPGSTTTTPATTTTVVRESAPASDRTVANTVGGLDATALYANAAPGVVDITASSGGSSFDDGSPFGAPGGQGSSSGTATGTGFVVDEQGHIVTAAHVVDNATSLTVAFQDGTTRTAHLLGKDDATDVAVLKVDPAGLTLHPLQLGSSASLKVGDPVAAIGDPFGYERSISTGIVSGVDRTIQAPNGFTVAHAIQTDAALNPGNSGGPVLNAAGQVIGIADQIATGGSSNGNTGVGFAVPIDLVKAELGQLKAGESVRHAYLGISTADATSTTVPGAIIAQVVAGGPAEQAGVRAGDTITAVGSTQVHNSNDLVAAIAAHRPGDRVELTVRRGSETKQVSATLVTQPSRVSTQ